MKYFNFALNSCRSALMGVRYMCSNTYRIHLCIGGIRRTSCVLIGGPGGGKTFFIIIFKLQKYHLGMFTIIRCRVVLNKKGQLYYSVLCCLGKHVKLSVLRLVFHRPCQIAVPSHYESEGRECTSVHTLVHYCPEQLANR